MKLYTTAVAPNPRRVTIFLNEKGIDIPTVELDLGKSEHLTDEFAAKNPMARVPVLELDDGTYLAESLSICRYFEEIQPEPPLFGVGARDKAEVDMWNRRMESEVLGMISGCFRNTHPYWEGKIPQFSDFGENCRATVLSRMEWLDSELADREFIAGDRFTVADITAHTGFALGRIPKIRISEELKNLQRWYDAVAARPSVSG
jgi:glutathione S-transferase